jgi:hypothetical protein
VVTEKRRYLPVAKSLKGSGSITVPHGDNAVYFVQDIKKPAINRRIESPLRTFSEGKGTTIIWITNFFLERTAIFFEDYSKNCFLTQNKPRILGF